MNKKTLEEKFRDTNDFYEAFFQAYEKHRLVFFIGAGVSRLMGIPGWDELADKLIRKTFPNFYEQSKILNSVENNKEKISISYEKLSSDNRLDEFYKIFGEALQPKENIDNVENIYEILKEFKAQFLTTNADNLFQHVLGDYFCHVGEEFIDVDDNENRKIGHLYYLHGHYTNNIDHQNDHLVFTAKQYVKRYNDNKFQDFLRKLFANDNTIVFIGYGMNEFEIIDYIVNKAGNLNNTNSKVFLMHPFCKGDDVLYQAKKSYFESLNIELVPYDISNKGYISLIDNLKNLLHACKEKTIVPISENIKNCINEYSEKNYHEILRYLTDENLSKDYETIIIDSIDKSLDNTWIKKMFEDGLFSNENISKRLSSGSWPILKLIINWLNSDDKKAQDQVSIFVENIANHQTELLKNKYSSILYDIVKIILSLDKNHIKQKYIEIIKSLSGSFSWAYLANDRRIIDNFLTWDNALIGDMLDILYLNANFDNFHDINSYHILKLCEIIHVSLNKYDKKNNKVNFLADYYIKLIIKKSDDKGNYNLFKRIFDIDNIERNHQEYWNNVIKELRFYFNILDYEKQQNIVNNLIKNDSNVAVKISLYLSRKYNIKLDIMSINIDIFNDLLCYHELYLAIENNIHNEYFGENVLKYIVKKVNEADFGYKNLPSGNNERTDISIKQRQLAILYLIPQKYSHEYISILQAEGIKPYDSKYVANQCDYVHTIEWEKPPFPVNEFINRNVNEWHEIYQEKIPINYDFEGDAFSESFLDLILQQKESNIKIILNNIIKICDIDLISFSSAIIRKIDLFKNSIPFGQFCLLLLRKEYNNTNFNKQLVKNIFNILNKLDIKDYQLNFLLLQETYNWLTKSINNGDIFNAEDKILENLINKGDYEKYTYLINSCVKLKKLYSFNISNDDIERIKNALTKDYDKTFRYTLCYNYNSLYYVLGDQADCIFNQFLSDDKFDFISLLFCIYKNDYISEKLALCIQREYIDKKLYLSQIYQNEYLLTYFYHYIVSAVYYKFIKMEDLEKMFADVFFADIFLQILPILYKKENFLFDEWIIPFWNIIKQNDKIKDKSKFAAEIIITIQDNSNPTQEILNLYLEVIDYINRIDLYRLLDNLIKYLDFNYDKANDLLKKLLGKVNYIVDNEMDIIIEKYKKINRIRDCKILLNELKNNGIIGVEHLEKYAKKCD